MRFVLVFLLAPLSLFGPLSRGAGANDAAPASAATSNYVHSPHLVALRRWKRMPVRVYFSTGGAYTPERQRLAQAGFDEWVTASGNRLRYTSVRDAEVTVRFVPCATVGRSPNTLGQTLISSRGGNLWRAQMQLATDFPRPEDMIETAAHEWGHALGINGHSDDPHDLMYSVTTRYIVLGTADFTPPPLRTVSERDLNTIKAAYADLFKPKK